MLGPFCPKIVVIGKLLSIYSAFVFRNLFCVEKSGFSEEQKSEGSSPSFKKCITTFYREGKQTQKSLFDGYQYSVFQDNKNNDKSFTVGSQKSNFFKL